MHRIIVKLLNCSIVPSPNPSFLRRGTKGVVNNLAIEQCSNNRFHRGFTLIELLVVVAVLGILAGGILIALNIGGTIDKANITKAKKFAAQLENGLAVNQVGKWSFEEPSGNALDTSGYENNGTLQGNAVRESPANCDLDFGQCVKLDGSGDYITVLSSFLWNLGTDDFTIAFWMKPNGANNNDNNRLFNIGAFVNEEFVNIDYGGTTGNGPLRIYASTAGALRNIMNLGDGAANGIVNHGITNDAWNYIVLVRKDKTSVSVYVNGNKLNVTNYAGSQSGAIASGGALAVGAQQTGPQSFNGLMDEVQIYNEALTLSQVRELYVRGVIRRAIAYK